MIQDPLVCDEILYKMRHVKHLNTNEGAYQFLMANFKPSYESKMSEGDSNQKKDIEIKKYSNWCFDIDVLQPERDTRRNKGTTQGHANLPLIEKVNSFLFNSSFECCMNDLKNELNNSIKLNGHAGTDLSFHRLKRMPQKKQHRASAA